MTVGSSLTGKKKGFQNFFFTNIFSDISSDIREKPRWSKLRSSRTQLRNRE